VSVAVDAPALLAELERAAGASVARRALVSATVELDEAIDPIGMAAG
jgi:hypothetical protein